ncbi:MULTISPECIES: hypothetical protein [unclassified Streptomyces]|uniref:hypothetical protein n=1 Tax=unclassified Streptomyces TaxID=2593676 RepID=UPI002E20B74B|nr:hypothetical protein OG217_38245 [Streptomyces sp. NBC_01023]
MTSAALPSATKEAMPRIEYRQFKLVDDGALLEVPESWPQAGEIVVAAGRGVLFTTGGNDFYPKVRVEVWPTEPGIREETAWEVVQEVDFLSETGTVELREWDGPTDAAMRVGAVGPVRLRAHCKGRAEAAALVGQELYYEGVEEWLLQIWPLHTSNSRPEAS